MYIISSAADGMVNVTTPAPKFMAAVTQGGFGQIPGAEMKTAQSQIENSIKAGFDPDFSSRFVTALVVGGETDAGGRDLIRIRHLYQNTNHQVQSFPTLDRWFRDAWRQDAATGVLYIDMVAARLVFAKKLIAAKGEQASVLISRIETAILAGAPDAALEAAHQALKDIDLNALAGQMAAANSPAELSSLWPASALGVMTV